MQAERTPWWLSAVQERDGVAVDEEQDVVLEADMQELDERVAEERMARREWMVTWVICVVILTSGLIVASGLLH